MTIDDRDPSVYDVEYVALDLETTGLTPYAEVCEVGAVRFDLNGREPTYYQTLVRPRAKIPSDATACHGITDEMVRNAPRFEDIAAALSEFMSDAVLIAHNARFELRYLKKEDLIKVTNHIDTLNLARYCLESPNYKLGTLEPTQNWHRALPDAISCMKVFRRCVDYLERKNTVDSLSLSSVLA